MRKENPRSGFTLIELLVVIAIIAILAALVLNTAGFIQKKAARARAESEIAALSAALESYKADNGDYPSLTNANGNNSPNDNTALRTNLSSSTKVYFEFSKTMGANLTNGPITDPFGENYGYQYPGDANRSGTNFFDLFSRAASSNTNQWIVNW
jgi:type II secretion system protein G